MNSFSMEMRKKYEIWDLWIGLPVMEASSLDSFKTALDIVCQEIK